MKKWRMGLVISEGRAMYGWGHGLILPDPVLRLIARIWNHVACRVLGHDDVIWHLKEAEPSFPDPVECSHCRAPLNGCVGNHKQEG